MIKGLNEKDMERIVKMCVAMSQQEGTKKGVLELNKDFLKYYDHVELTVIDNKDHMTLSAKVK